MFSHWVIFALCTLTLSSSMSTDKDLKLVLVQMLYRHGDRAPLWLYPNDPNPESIWPEGLGSLTMLGKRQHYNLGKYFRDFYKDFHTSSPLEVNVTSGDDDRCLKSAEANLASFYAPKEEWKFDKNVDWQPIAIRYLPKRIDKYLQIRSDCPRADLEELRVANSPEGKEFTAKHQEMYDYMTKHSGKPITGWESAALLCNNIWIEMFYNLTIPDWVEPYWKELNEVKEAAFYWMFKSPLLHRLRAGPLLQRMIKTMEDKIEGKIPDLKFQIFSAHDTNMAVFLLSINLYDMTDLPYCSTVLVELFSGYNDSNDSYFVRLLYLNSTDLETISQTPHILILDGCTEFCPLQYFIDYTKHLIPDDWEKECQLPESYLQKFDKEEIRLEVVLLAVVVSVIVAVSFAAAVFKMYSKRRNTMALLISVSSI